MPRFLTWVSKPHASAEFIDIPPATAQLEGVKCNRLALNARVRVTVGDLVQLGEVQSGGSYLSQNDLRIHFGLGDHERVDQAEVLWPDGTRETLTNLAADRFYVVREGVGIVSRKLPVHLVGLP